MVAVFNLIVYSSAVTHPKSSLQKAFTVLSFLGVLPVSPQGGSITQTE